MARLSSVLVLTIALLAAGCLGPAGESLEPASNDSASGDASNETGGDDSNAGSSNTSEEEDEESASEDGEETGGEEETSEDEQQDDQTNASEEDPAPPWPNPADADIRPGVQILAEGQCTSNFLFRTPDNTSLMLGVAAHCVADKPDGVSGCSDEVDPLEPGAEVEIEGASQAGVLRYSSLYTMQQQNTSDGATCWNNDFALVEIHPADRGEVHPAVQNIGGPTGLAASGDVSVGDDVVWYGASSLTPDSEPTRRHEGKVVSSADWRFQAYSAAPGIPGDSGSGIMLGDGSAAGVLAWVQLVYPGANGMLKLDPALAFAQAHGFEAELVTWPRLDSGPVD